MLYLQFIRACLQEIGRQLAPKYTATRVTARELVHKWSTLIYTTEKRYSLLYAADLFLKAVQKSQIFSVSTQLTSLDTSLDYFMLADSSDQTNNDNSQLVFLENGCEIPVANRDLWKQRQLNTTHDVSPCTLWQFLKQLKNYIQKKKTFKKLWSFR